jgi:hypothetical protein
MILRCGYVLHSLYKILPKEYARIIFINLYLLYFLLQRHCQIYARHKDGIYWQKKKDVLKIKMSVIILFPCSL